MKKTKNKHNLPWKAWNGHIVTAKGPTDCVAFNVGKDRAKLIVDAVNAKFAKDVS